MPSVPSRTSIGYATTRSVESPLHARVDWEDKSGCGETRQCLGAGVRQCCYGKIAFAVGEPQRQLSVGSAFEMATFGRKRRIVAAGNREGGDARCGATQDLQS